MSGHVLRVTRDHLDPGARYVPPLPAMNRVLYVLDGDLTLEGGGPLVSVAANSAWHGAGSCSAVAGSEGTAVLRFELVPSGTAPAPAAGAASTPLLDHPIRLDPEARYLMRCDRVDFDLGAEALPHRHKGGGVRCLISGSLELRIEGEPARVIQPGQAWFESGRELVYAKASTIDATSFIRCSILPREIRGQSSIMYANPKDGASKRRRYTVFVDEPIELP